MKVKPIAVSIMAAAVFILGLNISQALAGNSFNFLGETTWTVTINETYNNNVTIGTTFPMTGAISKVGGNYYLFQGFVQNSGDGPFLLAGSGVLNGGVLYLTLNSSQQHTDSQTDSNRDTGVMHVQVDPSTLNGTFYEVGHDFDRVPHAFSERFTAGTVTLTGQVLRLNSSIASPGMLLLLN
jgi:hypothetical protein